MRHDETTCRKFGQGEEEEEEDQVEGVAVGLRWSGVHSPLSRSSHLLSVLNGHISMWQQRPFDIKKGEKSFSFLFLVFLLLFLLYCFCVVVVLCWGFVIVESGGVVIVEN
mmetsp:Transcript_35522/g.48548  ORF Transcript_35522/g.48548 Transcript_35522/m.48548 type:complete len:110 (+) Transcript_35522:200-529(+)